MGHLRVRLLWLLVVAPLLGGFPVHESHGDDAPAGPRARAWAAAERALEEGKPKTALEALAGIERAATGDEAWAEVARAIATRIVAETGDRPEDDPERLILLAAAIDKAPPEARGVLAAIQANWTWGYFLENRWRFQQRSAGGADASDIRSIATWDLPTIVTEIRRRFATAIGAAGSPERRALERQPVADWSAIIKAGTMRDAYRPTVWDVVVRDAIEFANSGERGLVAPEDAYELDAASPALGTAAAFLAWDPAAAGNVTDTDSPLLESIRLYQDLLRFHAGDTDRTAFLAADLDRVLWAGNTAVSPGGGAAIFERKRAAFETFLAAAGDHEIAALVRFHLASLLRQGDSSAPEGGDPEGARIIAAEAVAKHPQSPGGKLCRNLVAEIDAKELSLQAERSWAAPWPAVRVNYRNLGSVHLRLARADWAGRMQAGKAHVGWSDDADRVAILGLPAVRTLTVDLPLEDDRRQRQHDVDVARLDPAGLEPGPYWLLASQRADFGATDNVVHGTIVWITRLGIVTEQSRQVMAGTADADGPTCAGHVVDMVSGEPVAGATVTAWLREPRGFTPAKAGGTATTDKDGRFALAVEPGREHVVHASAAHDGRRHETATEPTGTWRNVQPASTAMIALVTDRGIHRPGQVVFYKGVACASDFATGQGRAVAGRAIDVTFRDANGREVAQAHHTTTANGSFHGRFTIATGGLPGQWSLQAQAPGPDGFSGFVGVRVEEYKRPKFKVEIAAPERSVPLGDEVTVTGTATTYTGLAVAGAKVRWRVERSARWPMWCRWFFPGLPFDAGAQRIARGTALTDEAGRFTVTFPALADRSVPPESLPVFSFQVVADVTDAAGETRSDEQRVSVGYTDLEAAVSADAWQAVETEGKPARVAIRLTTTTLDGRPRAAAGALTVARLVQPAAVPRGDYFGGPLPLPRAARGRGRGVIGQPAPRQSEVATWPTGEIVLEEPATTDEAQGAAVVTANLSAGIYKAVFEIPAVGAAPSVRAERIIEVLDPTAMRYGVRRPLALLSSASKTTPGAEFLAVVGTGYDAGRVLVEVSRAGAVLSRFWTDAGRTQWPVRVQVGPEHRGGFTIRAWIVRDGRLSSDSQTIDVPWTDKQLAVQWERFTRRVEPATREVWRATVKSVPDPLAGPAAPVAAEMLAILYDQSLDALAPHAWPGDGLLQLFRRESSWVTPGFTNGGAGLHHFTGAFTIDRVDVPEMTYREFRNPFGSPLHGGGWGFGGGGGRPMRGLRRMKGAMPMAAMAAPEALADGVAMPQAMAERGAEGNAASDKRQEQEPPAGGMPAAPAAAAPPPRRNLAETAFFLPTLQADASGTVTIEFTLPDTLTTWQFKGLAHDAALRSGTIVDSCVSAKSLMVEPIMPRFLRAGDVVRIPLKVSNTSTGRLEGQVRLVLADARTDAPLDALIEGPREQPFDLAAGASQTVLFTVKVADGTEAVRYRATGSAGKAADGEEAFLPVLPRRVPVTETVPITLRGPGSRTVSLERLVKSADTTIESQSLVVQAASNPAWYAVLALPVIMEEPDESTEGLFSRFYANSLARHLATSDPRIGKIFEQWKGTAALESPLEKNADLVRTLLAETPWVRDAVDEQEARGRIALLFDPNRADDEARAALVRLESLRTHEGGWPWFPGGQTCDSVTLGIVAGFGRLRAAGAKIDVQPAVATIPWLDGRLVDERRRAEKLWGDKLGEPKREDLVLTPVGVYALYARSFFTADAPPEGEAAAAIEWALGVGRKSWPQLDARISQGHLAIALARSGDKPTALSIIDSLRERAVDADTKPGAEKDSWQGMWWRDRHPGWWSWAYAPIATQAIMIEAFDEVAGDKAAVEGLKAWLLTQKRTSRWPGSRATADAVGALLGRGTDLLASTELVEITAGGERIEPAQAEAGTGFFEERFVRREIRPEQGTVTLTKKDAGLAWGGVHWQYLDDIANVPAAGREELAIEKRLFVKRFTKAGPVLEPVAARPAADGGVVTVGDELVVRLVVTSDRDYEFLELADQRPSLAEPVDVLSGWRWGDGAGWYVAVRDASTRLYFERLPRGTHVFEYSLRAAHAGSASSGFATIQSRYAPEFSAHSASIPLEVK
jgi:hypothetical protein